MTGPDGFPLIVAVPFPLSTNVTPPGKGPVSDSAGTGLPVAVTINVFEAPMVNVFVFVLVIAGGVFTVTVVVVVTEAGVVAPFFTVSV